MNQSINGPVFTQMLRDGAANLRTNRQLVNDLNVFPIPDGDTGDNMLMTINSGLSAVDGSGEEALDVVAKEAARGMLLGARGNSGVILSRIFAGIAAGLEGVTRADPDAFGKAMKSGVEEAYRSVSVPVEGTILTVIREAVDFANSRLSPASTLATYFEDLSAELHSSLERTPDLLDVLKEAGVVDSGGAGLVYIAEGMARGLDRDPDDPSEDGETYAPVHGGSVRTPDISKFTEDSELTLGYCTEFLMRLQRAKTDIDAFDILAFRMWLCSVGDSVVAFKDGSVVKAHVHTKNPGEILNHCQKYGEFLTVKIENMTLQHNEAREGSAAGDAEAVNSARSVSAPVSPAPISAEPKHKKYGTVAVAAGRGLKDTFLSLGVDAVVDGGQSMNPSAQDFIDAFSAVNADHLLVFPNNGNIILTANQAAGMYSAAGIHVIGTRTVGEGYAALSMLDTEGRTPEEIEAELKEVIDATVTGFICCASRDSDSFGLSVKKGSFIGYTGDVLRVTGSTREETALKLAEDLDAGSFDVMLLCIGAEADKAAAETLCAELAARYRRTEIIPIEGDQPVHDYIMILE